jgi:hypothetical protein
MAAARAGRSFGVIQCTANFSFSTEAAPIAAPVSPVTAMMI